MKTRTTYGECPSCGQSCQPDEDRRDSTHVYEYAVCCDCELVWSYVHPIAYRFSDDAPEAWEEVWEPVNIETFDEWGASIPHECK